jgi:hypothetical protein
MKSSGQLRIFYVGQLCNGGTCLQRMTALQDLGHQVTGINTMPDDARRKQRNFFYRVKGKLFRMGFDGVWRPKDFGGANAKILDFFREQRPCDVLWIDKGLTIEPETLEEVKKLCPGCIIAGYSPDDMFARHNQSPQFLRHIRLYDIFFTTKTYGVEELRSLGCRKVDFVGNAFDPHTHRPMPVGNGDRSQLGGSVGFIGHWEAERDSSIRKLANSGITVRVWGTSWEKSKSRHANLILEKRPLWGDDYARAICSFDINLAFLRKINRDQQTTRSIEIPACGGFMLAERTSEHQSLFEEGKEAEFFGFDGELIDKVHYYLAHPEQLQQIAAAGRQRCLSSGYSTHERMREMLKKIQVPASNYNN